MTAMTTVLSLTLVACEPSHDVTIENGTNSILVIYGGTTKIATLEPGQVVVKRASAPFTKWPISAKNLSGKEVYSKEWTIEELNKSNWKVVITIP